MKQNEWKTLKKRYFEGKITLLVCFLLFFLQVSVFAQKKNISGKVTDVNGMELPGASVIIKGTTNGTETGLDGTFSVRASSTDVLVFNFLGFKQKEVTVGNSTTINVTLIEDSESLDEVVVVGYGTQKKSDITGAVGQVKSEDFVKVAVVNPTDALQGRVAGVTVVKSSGAPGSGVDVKIRGVGTNGNNQPLYIVDGVQTTSYYLDPNNIESIEVLKDVSSAAIYGTRAANGVVIITTKKGKKGDIKVELDSYISFNSTRKQFELLDSQGYVSVHKQMYENAGTTTFPNYINNPGTVNTNWLSSIFRDAIQTNHSVRFSGATDEVNYSLAGNIADEEGVILGSDFNKKNIALNLGFNKGKFSFQGNITYAETKRQGYRFSLRNTYHLTPLVPIYDATKESGYGYADDASLPDQSNPIAIHDNTEGYTKLQYTLLNGSFGYEVFKGLQAKLNVSQVVENNYSFGFSKRFRPNRTQDNSTYIFGQVSEFNSQFKRQTTEALLTYKNEIGKHKFDALIGYSRIFEPYRQTNAVADGYKLDDDDNQIPADLIDPNFKTINAFSDGTRTSTGTNSEYALVSQFGRVNYSYDDKYLFQASIRRDGSSKFGENNKYGIFPSLALGWKISEENFLKDNDLIDFLKLRFSWGKAGNDSSLGNYDFFPLIEEGKNHYDGGYVFGGTPTRGAISRDLENPDLKWEVNTSTNIGVDFRMLNNKLSGSANYYTSLTSDLLFRKTLATSAGLKNPFVNIGEFQNQGIELDLNYNNSINDFKYSVGVTFTTVNNEVKKLANEGQEVSGVGLKFGSDHFVNSTRVGYEAGAFFLYEAAGIFQSQEEIDAHDPSGTLQPGASPGDIRFIDQNNDGKLDEDDLIYSGTGVPKYEYSINLGFEYKGFDATIFLQGVGGNKIYDGNAFEMQGMEAPRNFTSNTLNAWTPTNTNTNIPRAVLGDPNQNNRASTRFLNDGSYLRFKTIQLGYTLPSRITDKIELDFLRLYLTGQNLFTITDYSGLDPEVGGSVLSNGIDRTLYPKYKSIIMGIQIKL